MEGDQTWLTSNTLLYVWLLDVAIRLTVTLEPAPYMYHLCLFLKWSNELSGETTLSNLFYLPSEKGFTLKGKNLLRSEQILSL